MIERTIEEIKPIVETLLFISSKPISEEKLAEVLEIDDKQLVRQSIVELQMDYTTSGRAISIVEIAQGFQMCSKPQYSEYIKKLNKSKAVARLSKPALETLSIIAYKQPITRLEIESIRGVNVGGVIQTLLERRLIKIRGRKDVIGRPLLYGTTNDFLQYFGLRDLTELPKLAEIPETISQEMINNQNNQASEQPKQETEAVIESTPEKPQDIL
jgi:segregation and condensation protein B